MKNLKALTVVMAFLFIIAMLSCDKDDNDLNLTNDLIGKWQRSDFSDAFEFTIVFLPDNIGYKTQSNWHPDGTGISSAVTIKWRTNGDLLTLIFVDGDTVTTNFSINANGQLFLKDYSDLYFNRLE